MMNISLCVALVTMLWFLDMASVKMESESHIWVEQVVEKVDPLKKRLIIYYC